MKRKTVSTDENKRKRLEAAGWKFEDANKFLALSNEDAAKQMRSDAEWLRSVYKMACEDLEKQQPESEQKSGRLLKPSYMYAKIKSSD